MTKAANIRKRRAQRARAKNPISAVKSKPREDPRRVALEARQRVLGLPEHLAGHEKAATVLGRLWLTEVITTPMREAGERYLELYQAYQKAIKAPVAFGAGSGSANDPDVTDDYVDWATRAVAHYEVIKAALNDYSRAARVAVEIMVLRDLDMSEYMVGAAVSGLHFLARKLGFENIPRAA